MPNEQTEYRTHYLYPGNIFVSATPYKVTTVLGSCVSVCLWDPARNIGGINHYMLPLWNGEGLASPKYGNIAIDKLLEKMLSAGAKASSIQAKVFGGGEVLRVTSGILNVGERNAVYASSRLEELKIPIVSSSLGGQTGRKLIYDTYDGTVLMKKLSKQIDDIKP